MVRTITLTLLLLTLRLSSFGQNIELENKLKQYFENIPVLQTIDSIVRFVHADTSKYETTFYLDSVTSAIKDIDIYRWHYEIDTSYSHIYYRTETPLNKYDTIGVSIIGVTMNTITTFDAKKHYRKLKRKFANYFSKASSEKRSGMIGARWKTTSFYLNENDKYPCIQISWHNAFDLIGNGYRIDIIKTKLN